MAPQLPNGFRYGTSAKTKVDPDQPSVRDVFPLKKDMDVNENDEGAAVAAGGKAGGWSEAEKYNFLLKVIDQLSDGKSVKLADIEMPGRTTKALSHQWQKIRADAAAVGNGSSEPANKVAKKPATPRKKKATELDADGNVVKTPRKRKAKALAAETKDEEMD